MHKNATTVPLAQPSVPLNQVACLITAKAPVRYARESSHPGPSEPVYLLRIWVSKYGPPWSIGHVSVIFCYSLVSAALRLQQCLKGYGRGRGLGKKRKYNKNNILESKKKEINSKASGQKIQIK